MSGSGWVVALALAAGMNGQAPVVSHLDTVSIHVHNIETYNALLQLWTEGFQWPLMYGKPLTAEQKDRRNYAGIWGGNVRLELCGPYRQEFEPQDAGARLHGLTFLPHETAEKSARELDRHGIRRKPIETWGTKLSPLIFVKFDDSDMNSPRLSISIMEVFDRNISRSERNRLHERLTANQGGPLGLKRVREVRVSYLDAGALKKWQRFLQTSGESWPGANGPSLRFVKHTTREIAAAVLEVKSLEECARFLRGLGLAVARTPDRIECNMHGVRLVFVE